MLRALEAALWAAAVVLSCACVNAGESVGTAEGAPNRPLRILAVMTVDMMSHHLWMAPLTVELARRGHNVLSVDIAMPKEKPPTLNVSILETAFVGPDAAFLQRFQEAGLLEQLAILHKFDLDDCSRDLAAPAFSRILDQTFKETFDLILLDYVNDCQLGLAHRFGYPGLVVVSPFPGSDWLHDLMGTPPVPAVVCSSVMPFPHPMTLWQRAATAGLSLYIKLLDWHKGGEVNEVLRRHFGEDVPSAEELRKHVHLALVNDIPALDRPRHYTPAIVPVGGMHVRPANLSNIASDLSDWMSSAEEGFILMSFGTVMKGSSLKKDMIKTFVDSFKELRGVRILWKIEPEVVDKSSIPPNVRIEKWLPQNDIMGHPNLRLFVSHCGGLSTHESSSKGIPMLGVPLIVDQFMNAEKVVRNGMARILPFSEITKHRFVAEVTEMLRNTAYGDAARRTAALLHDRQNSALDTAVWWCEYVARHRGAPHLRSPALDVPWHQVMLLDVMALLVLVIVTVLAVTIFLLRTCLKYFFRKAAVKHQDQALKKTN